MPINVKAGETVASRRRVYFFLVETDFSTPATSEAGGQPEISVDGASWSSTGIGTLSAIGNGRYYADLTTGIIADAGLTIETRYKSSNTAECPGDTVKTVSYDPVSGAVGAGGGATAVDQDYGGEDELAYLTPNNVGIVGATVQVYLTSDYNAGNRNVAYIVGRTTTIIGGAWDSPVYLTPEDYTIVYYRAGQYGPDIKEITVT